MTVPPGPWPPGGDEPYTGPPPTGPYGAPPYVPGASRGRYPPPPGAAAGPVPWPLGPVPAQPAPHTHLPGAPSWQQAVLDARPAPPPAVFPPGVRLAPPPGTPPHDEPVPYLLAMRSRDWAWWRPLLGLLLFAVAYSVAAFVVVLLTLLTGITPDLALLDLVDPGTLLLTNLSLIVAIPIVWLLWVAAHGMRPGWSSSVLAQLRWRLFAPLTLRALATLGVGIGLSVLLGFLVEGGAVTGPVDDLVWLLLVVVLTTPIQSAAEEYVFRGYLSQAIAGWIRSPRAGALVAAVVTAALFSAAHAPGDVVTFLDRFAFGLAASAVVWLTGGLEAAIVLHAVNNVLVFCLAGTLGDGVTTDEVPAGVGLLSLLLTLLSMSAYVAAVAAARRRLHPELVTAARDLRVAAGDPRTRGW
ncbi:CPBP family intramembrane glutamic endopeptidase [Geodermatophilus sp. URMC 62]|uniref:CPBP family intramembrane glutamic endopeptidase n=1 Tax=Geodermatophilus sp. URMC 62 TaxID=3423414 RepID=UPI00406C63AD